jgi:hypothetical protein
LDTRPATSFHKTHPATKVQLRNARQVLLRQDRRVKRKKNLEIQIGSWNVITMLKPGRLQEIAEQMLETNLQIVALQEIRWKGYGKIKKDKYIIYYSCAEDNTGYAGTGFIVIKDIDGSVLGFEPYNERLCRLRIRESFIT